MQFLFCKDSLKSIGAKLLFWWFLLGGYSLANTFFLLFGIGFWTLPTIIPVTLAIVWAVCLTCIVIILNLILLFFKKYRITAVQHILAVTIAFLLAQPTGWLAFKIHIYDYYYAGIRSKPIIKAIDKYYEATGDIPENLDALTPQYIQSIPFNIPPFRTSKADDGWCLCTPSRETELFPHAFAYCNKSDFTKIGYPENLIVKLGEWEYLRSNDSYKVGPRPELVERCYK